MEEKMVARTDAMKRAEQTVEALNQSKDKYVVYEIIDCFDKSCSTKAIYRQGLEKIKIYEENKYNNRIINTKL